MLKLFPIINLCFLSACFSGMVFASEFMITVDRTEWVNAIQTNSDRVLENPEAFIKTLMNPQPLTNDPVNLSILFEGTTIEQMNYWWLQNNAAFLCINSDPGEPVYTMWYVEYPAGSDNVTIITIHATQLMDRYRLAASVS